VKRGHRVELGADLTRIERLADQTGRTLVLAFDPDPDVLAGVVCSDGRTAGDHVQPFGEQSEPPEVILVRFTGVG
jgi:hypothetical protein